MIAQYNTRPKDNLFGNGSLNQTCSVGVYAVAIMKTHNDVISPAYE